MHDHAPPNSGVFAALKSLRASFLFLALVFIGNLAVAGSPDTLHVVNWNIEYFGDSSHHSPAVQTAGVRSVMKAINADVYAICEVVDVDSFAAVVNSLPGNYGYLVSPFGSFASSPTSSGYASAQKLGFVYRKSIVRNPKGRALMGSSSSAYHNFSSGRFPYQVDAEVLGKDSIWHAITFIILHAKAYTDNTSCARRVDGCQEMKDTLDKYFATISFLLLGDFNDDLDTTNCGALFAESNYAVMVKDSGHYKALTLPISRAGAFSIDGYSSLIDHVIASDEMAQYYVPGSAAVLRRLVKSVDASYDHDISDHFPVRTQYVLNGPASTTVRRNTMRPELQIYPNPAIGILHVNNEQAQWIAYVIYDVNGRRVQQAALPRDGSIDVHDLTGGIYLLEATTRNGAAIRKTFRIGQ